MLVTQQAEKNDENVKRVFPNFPSTLVAFEFHQNFHVESVKKSERIIHYENVAKNWKSDPQLTLYCTYNCAMFRVELLFCLVRMMEHHRMFYDEM